MQKIVHSKEHKFLSPLFSELEQFYALSSEKTLQSQNVLFNPEFDNAFKPLQSLFNEYGGCEYDFKFTDKHYKKLELPDYNEQNVIVCFSGGKDSTALTMKLINLGYQVYLYHIKNINKSYPDEWKHACDVAEYLNVPIYFDTIELSGKLEFIEHPMKNMIIVNNALEFGIKNNIGTTIAVGNYYTGDINPSSFYICGDDYPETWSVYENIVQRIIPDFVVYSELESLDETMEIMSEDIELLELCQSCLGAHRFKQHNHDLNEKKYGIKLLKNRCGSCWKCCVEYIYLADHEKLEYNEDYYVHCLDVLKRTNKKENGNKFTDIESLWYEYLFYDIENSKYKNIHSYGRHKKRCSQL